jgi:hypothetical protein
MRYSGEEEAWSLRCQTRGWMTKEPVPFSTIREFTEWPEPEIDRLIQHLSLAQRENKAWVTVPTSDLREALIQLVRAAFNFPGK